MTVEEREAFTQRIARAIWAGEIAAGKCTTPAPITPEMKEAVMRAAAAAAACLDSLPAWT